MPNKACQYNATELAVTACSIPDERQQWTTCRPE